jgi:spermidine synthase
VNKGLQRQLRVLVFVVGAASLGAEIAAARLLAPWFGASTIVWANTIATVLVALSIGYAVGGRAADRNPSLDGLDRIVLVSAVLLALVPFVSGPFLERSVEAFATLSIGVFLGSLVGVGVLIAIPVLLLGMVSPYAVRLSVENIEDTGSVAGRLYAISTVGSLTGTFLAALVLIPEVGTRRTFLIFAASLALVAIPGLARRRVPALVVPTAIVSLIAVPTGTLKSTTSDGVVIWERETEYQYARVIESSDGTCRLELNEGQAIHSLYRPGSYLTSGYWDDMLVLAVAGASPRPSRVVVLGSAAGTTPRAIDHYFPHITVDAVEIDPAITQVGRELFDLSRTRVRTHTADARPWLQHSSAKFDAILVDAYRQPYIPFYLATREFFELTRDRLAPGGVIVINVGHPEGSDDLERVLTATLRSAYGVGHVWRDAFDTTNTMLIATTGRPDPAEQLRSRALSADLVSTADGVAGRLAPGLRGGRVFTDDRAPVEWLVDKSLARVAEQR